MLFKEDNIMNYLEAEAMEAAGAVGVGFFGLKGMNVLRTSGGLI